jgi:hypothetical protein
MKKLFHILFVSSFLTLQGGGVMASTVPIPSDAEVNQNFQRLIEVESYARDIGAYNVTVQRERQVDQWEEFLSENFEGSLARHFIGEWNVPNPGSHQLPGSTQTREYFPLNYAFYPVRDTDGRVCVLRQTERGISFAIATVLPYRTTAQLTVTRPLISFTPRLEDTIPFSAVIVRYNLLLSEIFQFIDGDSVLGQPVSDPVQLREPEVFINAFGGNDSFRSQVRQEFDNNRCYVPDFSPLPVSEPIPLELPPRDFGEVVSMLATDEITVRFVVASARNAPIQVENDDQILIIARVDNQSLEPVYPSRFLSARVNGSIQGGYRFGSRVTIPPGGSRCIPLLVPKAGLREPFRQGDILIYSFVLENIDLEPVLDARNQGLVEVTITSEIPNWPNGMSDFCPR